MKAIERNEELYNTLISFTENDDVPNDNASYTPEYSAIIKILYDSEYIETVIKRKGQTEHGAIESRKYGITDKGWHFMEYYENHKANKKLMSIQLEDYKSQKKNTRISEIATIITVILWVATFFYQGYKIDKTTNENTILRDSIVLLRTSHAINAISNDTTHNAHR